MLRHVFLTFDATTFFTRHLLRMNDKTSNFLSQKFACEICDYYTDRKTDFEKHLLTKKHLSQLGVTNSNVHVLEFACDICDYTTSRLYNLQQHKITNKHNKYIKTNYDLELLSQKGMYPYDFMDDREKFEFEKYQVDLIFQC